MSLMNTHDHHKNVQSLVDKLGGGVAVFSAYTKIQRSNDASAAFEQESNFWWLTGINAPDWWLIIDGTKGKSWLVQPEVSSTHAVFDGSLSPEEALRISGAEVVIERQAAESLLNELAKRHSVVYTLGNDPHAAHYDFMLNPAPKEMFKRLARIFTDVQDCRRDLAQLRAIKQPTEIAAIQKAINLTIDGFTAVVAKLPQLRHEYEVEAEFSYRFRSSGAVGHAYDPIVARGANACTLHYVANKDKLNKRELLLLDIGARVDGYAADITRTHAVGTPTKRQTQVHRAVQLAQAQIINLLGPNVSVKEYHDGVDGYMKQALLSLGLMADMSDEANYRKYFPHAISHGLGVDVHDSLGGAEILQPGMVLTVEPGIYIPEESIGVRIEDDILITETGYQNLSAKLSTDI